MAFRIRSLLAGFLILSFTSTPSLAFANTDSAFSPGFEEVNWMELMPKEDLDALLNPPDYINQIEDGSVQDKLDKLAELGATTDEQSATSAPDRYQQALASTQVIDAFNNKKVRLPGFVVPLQNNDQQKITEFFIVPYFGACLHLPPPPPNQIIHVTHPQGIEVADLQAPFWFEGTLGIQTVSNDAGTSAYAMKLNKAMIYEEE